MVQTESPQDFEAMKSAILRENPCFYLVPLAAQEQYIASLLSSSMRMSCEGRDNVQFSSNYSSLTLPDTVPYNNELDETCFAPASYPFSSQIGESKRRTTQDSNPSHRLSSHNGGRLPPIIGNTHFALASSPFSSQNRESTPTALASMHFPSKNDERNIKLPSSSHLLHQIGESKLAALASTPFLSKHGENTLTALASTPFPSPNGERNITRPTLSDLLPQKGGSSSIIGERTPNVPVSSPFPSQVGESTTNRSLALDLADYKDTDPPSTLHPSYNNKHNGFPQPPSSSTSISSTHTTTPFVLSSYKSTLLYKNTSKNSTNSTNSTKYPYLGTPIHFHPRLPLFDSPPLHHSFNSQIRGNNSRFSAANYSPSIWPQSSSRTLLGSPSHPPAKMKIEELNDTGLPLTPPQLKPSPMDLDTDTKISGSGEYNTGYYCGAPSNPHTPILNSSTKLSKQFENMDLDSPMIDDESDAECLTPCARLVESEINGGPVQSPVPSSLQECENMLTEAGIKMKPEWLGTSTFYIEAGLQIQFEGELDKLIDYRKYLVECQEERPYHPHFYIELGLMDNKLGFCDVAAGNGYRALVLVQSGLRKYKRKVHPPNVGNIVRDMIGHDFLSKRQYAQNPNRIPQALIDDELEHLECQAYKVILAALISCAAFYDGRLWAKAALKKYPHDAGLQELQADLDLGYSERLENLKEAGGEMETPEMTYAGRTGRIFQKPYPWMEEQLFHRTQKEIDAVNNQDDTAVWQVKPVVFGPASEQAEAKKGGNIGPLGVFAKRDIEDGELIMVDKTMMGVSDIPSSKQQHCDACHAALCFPYVPPDNLVVPECCKQVSYCSQTCHDQAMASYHMMLCRKDFDWLYKNRNIAKDGESKASWRPILFLRLMAIALSDMKRSQGKKKITHPLQHPSLSLMAANYKTLKPGDLTSTSHDWQFWENTVAPTRILMELGVDIFLEKFYTPEIIQTIYWRFENNANMGTTSIGGNNAQMIAINPNYLFINHSCDPNVTWHGVIPHDGMSINWLMDRNGIVQQPGSSSIFCKAGKNIKKGEELKISYIGDPKGIRKEEKNGDRESKRAALEKWFDNGCGCDLCEEENAKGLYTS